MEDLEEVNKILGICNILSMNQKEIENMKRPISSNEIESVIKTLQANKSPFIIMLLRCVSDSLLCLTRCGDTWEGWQVVLRKSSRLV